MIYIIVAFIACGVGFAVGFMANDKAMLGQEDAHRAQMDELFAELSRARTQVANLIGKE